MKLIERTKYLDRLSAVRGTPDIKVITGIRRSGKSKLLEALEGLILHEDPTANVIRVNFNLTEFEGLTDYHALNSFVEDRYSPGKENYLLIDEVQMCEGFERCINSLHASERFDIYITGSNAFLLSSDLATLFTGRTFQIEVFPFSLSEFATYYDIADANAALDRYAREGGMAGSYVYKDEQAKYDYIESVFDTLILRDIKQKYRIRNLPQLERLCDYLMANISNVSSVRNIAAALSGQGLSISDRTVGAYLGYLCRAFAFYRVRRFDVRGKRYLTSGDKLYLADHSFRFAKLGTKDMDYGRIFENIVAIELQRRGYETYAGMLYKKEVDFVAIRRSEKVYIQVCADISDRATFEREVSPLLQIKDAYPKIILARTRQPEYTYEGVRIIDLATWLMGE